MRCSLIIWNFLVRKFVKYIYVGSIKFMQNKSDPLIMKKIGFIYVCIINQFLRQFKIYFIFILEVRKKNQVEILKHLNFTPFLPKKIQKNTEKRRGEGGVTFTVKCNSLLNLTKITVKIIYYQRGENYSYYIINVFHLLQKSYFIGKTVYKTNTIY